MMEIELELTSNSKNVTEILEKVSQLVRKSQELGFEIKELEIESEHDKKDKEGKKRVAKFYIGLFFCWELSEMVDILT